jgi:hypothetical protein
MYNETCAWVLFLMTVGPQESATRIRVWRALKSLGAGVLRDGVYLLPAQPHLAEALTKLRGTVEDSGGSAFIFMVPQVETADDAALRAVFDRSGEYASLLAALRAWAVAIDGRTELEARRELRQLRRDYDAIAAVDFFPGSAEAEVRAALRAAEGTLTRKFAPEEPVAIGAPIQRLDASDFRQRVWATRRRIWADRAASAWLIRRFIDADARFVWLEDPKECPDDAVGFDFDGAPFTHVGERVTFEVLIESFGLTANAALVRIGMLIRALDTGTVNVPEAAGFEAMLTGARERYPDDDAMLSEITEVLNCFYIAYSSNNEEARSPCRTADQPSGKSTATS